MEQFNQYQRILPVSGRQRVIELLDKDPDGEYLLKVRYLDTGEETRINKAFIEKNWKPVQGGVQGLLFEINKTDKYKKMFKEINKKNHGNDSPSVE